MQYKNPLHIIRDKNLSSITPDNLKRWRKELMLRFNLGGDTTIVVNGREYDKQGVLDAFEDIQGDLSLHARILQEERLLNFLEEGDLSLFNDANAYDHLNEEGLFFEVKDWFIPRVSKTLVNAYRKKDTKAVAQVNKVFRFSEDMNELDRATCFSALFGEMSVDLISLKLKSQNPFVRSRDLVLNPDLAEYLNKDRLAFLKKLPADFSDIRDQYGQAAYRIVYALYQQRTTNYIGLDMKTLEILEAGVNISCFGASANNLRWLKTKSKDLEHIIKLKGKGLWGKYGEPLMYGCLIYIVLFTILFFAMRGSGSGSSKKSRNNSNVGGLVMDSVIDDAYWSKCMLGVFETKQGESLRRELVFDEKGKGQAIWDFTNGNVLNGTIPCRTVRPFNWKIIQIGNNEPSELRLTYDKATEICNLHNEIDTKQNQLPLTNNWLQHPEGFKFGKTEFILKQIDTSYLSNYQSLSDKLRLKIKRMDYLQKLQTKLKFSKPKYEKYYSLVSQRDYSTLYLFRKSGMGNSKVAEIKEIDSEPYLEFFEHSSEMPKEELYVDFKNIRYENRIGEIVVGDARVYKTSNRKIVLLEQ